MEKHHGIESHYVNIADTKIHYVEQGSGDPILFLHDIPTSSYIWRNVIPHLSSLGRCIAVDLIGMGKSDKPDIDYSISDHIHYLEKFIEALHIEHHLTLVMHGWGSIIGAHYAMTHEKNCKGLVFYESYLRPIKNDDVSLPFQEQLLSLNEQESEFEAATNGVAFVDKVLPQGMMRQLSNEELSHYREPFLSEGSGKPLHRYFQELPRGDGNSKADHLISEYSSKLLHSKLPKLLLYSIPGFITTMATVSWAKEHLPNLEIAEIGEDLHYAQESNPTLMGETISIWLQGVEQVI